MIDQLCLQYRFESCIIKRNSGGKISCGASVWLCQMYMPFEKNVLRRGGKKWKDTLEEETMKHQDLLEHLNIQLNWYGEFSDGDSSHYSSSISLITSGADTENRTTISTSPNNKNNEKISVHNTMKWLKFFVIRSPPCVNYPWKIAPPIGLMGNFTHM